MPRTESNAFSPHQAARDLRAPRSVPACRPRRSPLRPRAFTIVELIVVITVIILILALAVPAINAMNAEARLTSAQQTISSMLKRAYYLATSERTMAAVRLFPGKWDTAEEEGQAATDRQHAAVYTYVGTTVSETPSGSFSISMDEYFKRAPEIESAALPHDVWAAPLEALSPYDNVRDSVLTGAVGPFAFDAEESVGAAGLLNADDFLIVIDPEVGVRGGTPELYHMKAYAPTLGYEALNDGNGNDYRRYNYTGVVTYHREPFVALGESALSADRQNLLLNRGRAYIANRYSGGLVPGARHSE